MHRRIGDEHRSVASSSVDLLSRKWQSEIARTLHAQSEGIRQVRDGEKTEYKYVKPDEVFKKLKFHAE
jgi:hypothetical protein